MQSATENGFMTFPNFVFGRPMAASDSYVRSGITMHRGEPGEYVGITMDITERKRAEEERERLRQLEAELAHINPRQYDGRTGCRAGARD